MLLWCIDIAHYISPPTSLFSGGVGVRLLLLRRAEEIEDGVMAA